MPDANVPDWTRYVRGRLPLRLRPEREAEIVSELAQQLEQKYSELIAAGYAPAEAMERADAQVGDWQELAREIAAADATQPLPEPPPVRMNPLAGIRHDLVYALRFLRKKPTFALLAAGTLAFGIGANAAMFAIVDAVMVRGLPYPASDRLITLGAHNAKQPEIALFTSAPDFFDLRQQSKTLSEIAGISPVWNMITGGREADRLECLFVSSNFFPMLGVSPALGRTFTQAEDPHSRGAAVAVLSYSYWQGKFGGRTDVLNKTLVLDNSTFSIIGVLPAGFRYAGEPLADAPEDISVYLPLSANPLIATQRSLRFLKVAGRLAPGATVERARSELRTIGARLASEYPQSNREMQWELQPLSDEATGRYREPVFLLLGAVGCVLLLASANVANLLLARVAERRQEMSVRTALGASSWRILRQLLAESLVLASLGGVLGTVTAILLLKVLNALGPRALMSGGSIRLDVRTLLFTAGVVIAAAVLSGLMPAWHTMTAGIGGALRAGSRSVTPGSHRFRSGLVIAQMALAVVLLVGAGLLIRSFQALVNVDPGFRAQNLTTIATQLPASASTPEQRTASYHLIHDRLVAIPGVEQVGAVSRRPMMGSDLTSTLVPEGKVLSADPGVEAQYRRATPDYFAAVGIPLLRGRVYDEHDSPAAPVALVDETAARLLWPGESAVGKRVKVGTTWTTIVGVTGATRAFGLDVAPRPTIYVPYAESPLSAPILVIRTSHDPGPILNSLTEAVRGPSHGLPAYDVFPMQTLVDRSTAQTRFVMLLLTGFAGAAMLLAAIGVYGSVTHTVAQRTREIGLRMALGASPGAALRMVLGEGLQLAVFGIGIGVVAAAGLTRLMQAALFEVKPLDPLAFVAAALVLGGCAIVACSAPAIRAARVDPLIALRDE